MSQAEFSKEVTTSAENFFKAVTDYAKYPDFVDEMDKVSVERTGPTTATVKYQLQMMGKNIQYVLSLNENPTATEVSWTLVESDFFKKNDGGWKIKSISPTKANVTYWLDVEFKVPVPGFILKSLVKGSLPSMLENFEKRAKTL